MGRLGVGSRDGDYYVYCEDLRSRDFTEVEFSRLCLQSLHIYTGSLCPSVNRVDRYMILCPAGVALRGCLVFKRNNRIG